VVVGEEGIIIIIIIIVPAPQAGQGQVRTGRPTSSSIAHCDSPVW
jgi:hypothetical protein